MKSSEFVVLIMLLLLASLCLNTAVSHATEQNHPMLGEKAPVIALERHCIALSDVQIDLDEAISGKTTLIIFWSEHCLGCQNILSFLNELKEKHGGRLVLVGVNTDHKYVYEKAFVEDWADMLCREDAGVDQSYLDEELKAQSLYQVDEIPTTFVINNLGRITMVVEKYSSDYRDKISKEISRLVGE